MLIVNAFYLALRSWRMVLWVYFVNFLVSLLVLLPGYATLRSEAGSSLEYLKLLDNFDYTVYTDFMHESESAIDPLLSVGRWLGVLYVFISVFFSGGILLQITLPAERKEPFRLARFLPACVHYFGRFFRLFLCVFGFILLFGVAFILIGALIAYGMNDSLNEQGMIYCLLICLLVFAILALLLVCVGDYAKILMFRQDETRAFVVFRQAMRFVGRNFRTAFGLYLLLIGIGAVCFGIYFLIDSWIVTSSWMLIVLLFIFQQIFIFSRVFLKVWTLATARMVFANREVQAPTFQPI